jgi:dTDP-glucose 4,6-dehydratase
MRHVVLGGSGFTGKVLLRALVARGERPLSFDLQPLAAEFEGAADGVIGDIVVPADLARIGLGPDDVIYNLAARQFHGTVPHEDRYAWFADVNVVGTARLLDAMAAGGTERLVFFSTDMTYGKPDITPVPVTHPQRPFGPYGRSKLAAETLIRQRAAQGKLKATIFRPRLISGAGRLGILAKLFLLIDKGLPVPMIGAGTNRYQMIAVEDCVSAALRAVELDCPAGPFNLGSYESPTVRELLGEIIRRAGSRSILVPTPAFAVKATLGLLDSVGLPLMYPEQFKIADEDYLLDTSATEAALGWKPSRSDTDILFEAFDQFRAGK